MIEKSSYQAWAFLFLLLGGIFVSMGSESGYFSVVSNDTQQGVLDSIEEQEVITTSGLQINDPLANSRFNGFNLVGISMFIIATFLFITGRNK